MKIGLPNVAMVLFVYGLAVPLCSALAQQPPAGDHPASSGKLLPKNPLIVSCLQTILYGDLAYANYDSAFPPPIRRKCLQWLKARTGKQLEEENKRRAVALSLNDEIKQNRAGTAAHRAAENRQSTIAISRRR